MDVDRAVVEAMAEGARWAPSVHNSQPWRFRGRPDGLDVLVDPVRALPELDPAGRLRTVSCGAAAAAAGAVSTALGLATRTALLPEGPRGDVVARLVCVAERTPSAADRRLAAAVPHRRSHPLVHPDDPPDDDRLDDLSVTVEDEGVTMTVLDAAGRGALVDLVREAVEEHARRPGLLSEARGWLRTPARAWHAEDGLLRPSVAAWPYPAGTPVLDDPALVGPVAADAEDTTVVVLSTATDTRRDHLVAGIALGRMLLHATALDLVAAFCDLATALPTTRARLRRLLARPGHAQVALRLGGPLVDVRTPPRRPLADLLDAPRTPAVVDLTDPVPHRSAPSQR